MPRRTKYILLVSGMRSKPSRRRVGLQMLATHTHLVLFGDDVREVHCEARAVRDAVIGDLGSKVLHSDCAHDRVLPAALACMQFVNLKGGTFSSTLGVLPGLSSQVSNS
jgi:hypothetical protein